MPTIEVVCDTLTYHREDDPLSKDEPYLVVIAFTFRVHTGTSGTARVVPGSLSTRVVGGGPHNNLGRGGDNWARKGSTYGFGGFAATASFPDGEPGWVTGMLVTLMEEDGWSNSTAAVFRDAAHDAVKRAISTLALPATSSVTSALVTKILTDLKRALGRWDIGSVIRSIASAVDPDDVGGTNVVLVATLPDGSTRMHAGTPTTDATSVPLQLVDCGSGGSTAFRLPFPAGDLSRVPSSARYQGRCEVGGKVLCRSSPPRSSASGGRGAFLLYQATTGNGATAVVDGAGNYRFVGPLSGFSKDWSHVVATGAGGALFYDARTGVGATAVLDGAGRYRFVGSLSGFSKGWTHIAGAGSGGLLFYDATTGVGATAVVDGAGRYRFVGSLSGFSKGWTHVVAAGDALLFYDARTGVGATALVDGAGRYRFVGSLSGFSKDWSRVVAATNGGVLFYAARTGTGATAVLDGAGRYRFVGSLNGFSTGWTHLAAT